MEPDVRMRRIYDSPADDDGIRVLVDRRWPRGVSKERAGLDEWCSAVAPSDGLRKWFGHTPEKFEEFGTRYRKELADPGRASALRHLRDMASRDRLTLLTATRRVEISQAAILVDLLRARVGYSSSECREGSSQEPRRPDGSNPTPLEGSATDNPR